MEVVYLTPKPKNEPNQGNIDRLKLLIKKMEDGEIRAVATIECYYDKNVGVFIPESDKDFHNFNSGCVMLQHLLNSQTTKDP